MVAEFRPRRSRAAVVILWLAVAGTIAAIGYSAVPAVLAVLSGTGAVGVGLWQTRQLRRVPPLLGYDGAGWYLEDSAGRSRGCLWRRWSLLPGFIALRWDEAERRSCRSMVLFADALGGEDRRRLRMLLQCFGN